MTKAASRILFAGLVALLAVSYPLRAAETAPSKPYVVLVGVSNYADKQIKPRVHAEDDAKALYDLFTTKEYLGADPKNVKLLLGAADEKRGSQPATRDNILKALQWLAASAGPKDLAIFAYFGEGAPLAGNGERRCYFASDSTFKDRGKDAVAAADIEETLKALKSQRFCAFLDVDFKGFTDAPKGTPEPTLGSVPYKEFLGDDGTEDHLPVPGHVIFLATNGLKPSLDLEKHGIFTEVILAGLKGAADKEGYEPDGVVTVDELVEYMNKELPELLQKHGTTKEQKEQLHFVLGGQGNHFVLTRNPAVAAKVEERVAAFQKLVKNGKVPAKFAEEGEGFLERMPRLEAQRSLRKAYQQLVDGKLTADEFEKQRDTILEQTRLRRSDALAYAKKVMDGIDVIRKNYVKETSAGEMAGWAIRGLYRRIDEKIPDDVQAKLKDIKSMKDAELVTWLADVREKLGKREDLDKDKDLHISLQRMLANLDPYTTYIDPATLDKFKQDIDATFTGIGIQIRKDTNTGQLLVVTPIKGSPAYRAGLQPGDIITKIVREMDGKGKKLDPPEEIATKGLPLNDAVKNILGQAGTKVKLVFVREGEKEPKTVEITRARIEVETVLGWKRNEDNANWEYMIDDKNKIGYIRLTSFSRNSFRDLKNVVDDLVKQGMKGFILDLRFNPGGLLDSAVDITDLFVDDGLIVSIRPRGRPESKIPGHHEGSLLDFPMVCMVNGFSASGSEIVSAALQDHKRALIVGERSYGKGSVQNIMPFEGGELKFTTATFWRPSGKNLNKASTGGKDDDEWGVTPDKVVSLTRKEQEDLAEHQHESEVIRPANKPAPKSNFKDKQLDTALEYLRDQIKMAGKVNTRKAG
jgi:C-terminal peptidase prc